MHARGQAQGRTISAAGQVALAAMFVLASMAIPHCCALDPGVLSPDYGCVPQLADSGSAGFVNPGGHDGEPTDIEFRRGGHRDGDPDDIERRNPQAGGMEDDLSINVSTWPNPSHGLTAVCFDLPSAMDVDVCIYDPAGRRIATIVSGPTAAGPHRIPWRGDDDLGQALGTGVYFARLATDRSLSVSRLLLIR